MRRDETEKGRTSVGGTHSEDNEHERFGVATKRWRSWLRGKAEYRNG